MWKPLERFKFHPSHGRIPSHEQALGSRLFSPVQLGPLTLAHRTWVPAMVPWRSNEQGEVTPDVIDWYRRFAQGRPGAIVIEATGIRDVPSGPLLRIGDDRYLPGLQQLTRAVHEASQGHTRLLIQLIDFLRIRRRPEPETFFLKHLELKPDLIQRAGLQGVPSDQVRLQLLQMGPGAWQNLLSPRDWLSLQYGAREQVNDTHLPHIQQLHKELPDLFAHAAVRARQAGFDGIELHYAHAYTMASFLSATNVRTDGYGGSPQARVRLPLEVLAQVRRAVGADYAVGCRFLADECIEGGSTVADATQYALAFAQAGMDFFIDQSGRQV